MSALTTTVRYGWKDVVGFLDLVQTGDMYDVRLVLVHIAARTMKKEVVQSCWVNHKTPSQRDDS